MNKDNYGVYKFLDVSMIHLSKNTYEFETFYRLSTYPEGIFFWVPSGMNYPVPDDLKIVFDYARENDCMIVRFDDDGMLFPEFPEYDWE